MNKEQEKKLEELSRSFGAVATNNLEELSANISDLQSILLHLSRHLEALRLEVTA